MKIIDAHCHIFPQKVAEKAVGSIGGYYSIPMYGKGTVPDLLAQGGKINVCKYVVHSTATKVEQVKSINDYIAGVQEENPCFIGFGTLHPGLQDVKAEVERIISLGLHGIKLHPDFQNFSIDDEDMLPVYSAVEGKLPVMIHVGDENSTASSPQKLRRILDMFPGLTVIAAHLGGYRMWDDSMKYLVGRDVYFDTSSSLFMLEREKAIEIIRKHGVRKVLFGTDYPMWSHEKELARFVNLGLSQDEQELILWKNACGLLGLHSNSMNPMAL